ncbi:SDR family NAD(P)-dependent oxidoreductase [Hyalangium gracile]|uniref:SDR family NAD(P)-dependent oxidoreductase n=1 Tax=Hyalangium gracile TaxID=394092 RepID=UPI001CCE1E66|nr:glucose 1-dehydrogenase [Hyalangium gracile]
MQGIAGKIALVTGGSSGIGLATAQALGRAGAKVAIAARNADRGESAVRALREAGADALFIATDVSRSDEVQRLVDGVMERWGRLDLAVNNASLAGLRLAPLAELSEEEFDRTVSVSLKGVWLCMKHELPAMLRGGGGAIVNVSSVNGFSGTPMAAAYCAAKHGVHGLSRTAAMEYGGKGVRVNVVCPGAHRTPMLEGVFASVSPGAPEQAEAMYNSHIPLGRIGAPEESARAIVWLLSAEASYVNGSLLTVDGGLAAGMS